jgi:hypothetical protein
MSTTAGGTNDEPVTRAEFLQLTEDPRQAQADLAEAKTAREKAEARDDVADAEEDLRKAAKDLGISPETLRKAAKAARTEETREELRPIVAELWAEERQREQDEAERLAAEEAAAKGDKPKREPKPKTNGDGPTIEETPPDTEPVAQHWGERHIGELLR